MEPADFFRLIKDNPLIAVWLALMLLGGLGRMIGGERGKAGRPGSRGGGVPPGERPPEASDLEERIRRNFEEMLRRRAQQQQQQPQPQQPTQPAPRAPTHAEPPAPRRPAREPAHSLEGRSLEAPAPPPRRESARVRPAELEAKRGDAPQRVRKSSFAERAVRAAHAPRTKVTAPSTRPARAATQSRLKPHALATALTRRPRPAELGALDARALRRALVLREVLDAPLALRDGREPPS
ncbi:MAG: hypothetical protein JNL90_06585 [Planctomycetes bacterium]|nr:hypothetical protein [Planctomycetota bacterium]